ncbi:PfkB family carbohydrate kinase [Peteryoungia ipomoeae]|uniref:Carbohydrate kinase n=1 Tax=Peteryoungia ipomoeae TaxID=1210932 RepID=A0A4S8NT60_9HYPH|nr:PfkB family carbohydrate kinase [Peteryoungia ipomoeae]THV20640.1 carbohydrate kinase [Peteryoungia ipomoeae]
MTADAAMPEVVVIGHVNHDRIWHLAEPLRSGARILWKQRETRLGGGGYFTARRLVELGHRVLIVSTLAQDETGRQALDRMAAEGLDTRLMALQEGQTEITDILLDPEGERTILASEGKLARNIPLSRPVRAKAIYVNTPHLPEAAIASMLQAKLSISQLPLRKATPRPADVIIGSKADLPDMTLRQIWQLASELAGDRLKHLVMTDGPGAVHIADGQGTTAVTIENPLVVRDTIGAGDNFSAGLLDGLLRDMPVEKAVRHANSVTAEWLSRRQPQ